MQQTSLDAFDQLKQEGSLSKRQEEVYIAITELHGATNTEISTYLQIPINTVTPRTNELVKLGLVKAIADRLCRVTGRRALVWGVDE